MVRTRQRRTKEQLLQENATLLARLTEAEELVRAAREADQALILQLRQEMGVRTQAEGAAEAERQRLYDVLDTLPLYVALLDKDYHVPFANRFFRERFGESHGRCCFEYLFNRTTVCEHSETYTVFRTGKPHRWEWTGPDGRHYDVHDFLFTDSDGSTLVLEMGLDVTEGKRAEAELSRHKEHLEQMILDRAAALAASEQRYRVLFETMTEGFAAHEIITDERGQPCDYRFLEVNPAFEQLTGLAPAGLIGKRVLEVLPATEPFWIETYGRVALTGEPVHFERLFAPLNRWYGVFAYRINPGQFAVIFSDITARKQAEQAVRESEARWRLAQQAANAGWWEWDLRTNENVWSDELWSVYGLEPGSCQPSYDAWLETIHTDDRARTEENVQDAARSGTELASEWRARDHGGGDRWLMSRGQPVRDASGTVVRYVGIVIDITARKRAEGALSDLNETLERRVTERTAEVQEQALRLRALAAELGQTEQRERKRLAQILHDHVQQLLAAARMELEVLKRKSAADETTENALRADAILNDAMRALRSLTVELSPPVLHEAGLVAGLRWLAARMGEQHQFHVHVRADTRAEPATEDVRLLLFECVRELLLNAVKHSGVREADVTITRTLDDRIKITVEDAGRGFEPGGLWSSADGRSTYGLFSVQERLAHFWGSMQIESAPGQGTRVALLAPLGEERPAAGGRAPGDAARTKTAATTSGPMARKVRVLIVDDHHVVREGLVTSLQFERDIDVVGEAVDAPQAVALAGTLGPDVVIMDVDLGTTSGIDATRDIRRLHPRISVLGLSIHEDEHVAAAMLQAGAAGYLSKAGRIEELIAAIRTCGKQRHEPDPDRPSA